MSQPSGITADRAAILTLGGVVNGDRVANVEPYFTDATTLDLDAAHLCKDLVLSWIAGMQTAFLGCLAGAYSLVFIQAEGAVDGMIPAREDFPVTTIPGALSLGAMPSNVCSLISYYRDPADIGVNTATPRMTVGKLFMSGVPTAEVTGDAISSTLATALDGYGTLAVAGFASVGAAGKKWYRAVAKPQRITIPAPLPCARVGAHIIEPYVATQRRRLLPHA